MKEALITMHITWSTDPENPRRLHIIINDELWREVDKYLFIRDLNSLRQAKDMNEANALFACIEEKVAKREALKLLATRSYFSEEFLQKLQRKGLSLQASQNALSYCKQLGYINEKEKTSSFVEREKRKGLGPRLIALKLRAKGVKTSVVQSSEDQLHAIKQLIEKRYANKEKHKVYQALKRRGFDDEVIRAALNHED